MSYEYKIVRTEEEINDLLNECAEQDSQGGSRFPGMTYEQGLMYAIQWLTGETDENPLE